MQKMEESIMSELKKNSEKQTVFKDEVNNDAGQSKLTAGKTSSGLEQNLAGLLCYLFGFITGIIFFPM